MTQPSPKSLILDLLSTLRQGAMPVRALVAAGELFGLSANSLRVSLARLCAADRVTRDGRGHYRLGRAAAAVDGHLQQWRRAHEQLGDWRVDPSGHGAWVGVHLAAAPRRSASALPEARALRLLGLRELEAGLFVRPDNLAGGLARLRGALHGLGLPPERPVFGLGELDDAREATARELWRPDALPAVYRGLREELRHSEARLARLPPERAMAESFLLGGRAIRTIALDPLLPDPIVAGGELAALVDATRRYDRAGRACWSSFLAAHGVAHRRPPVDARIGDATRALPHPMGNATAHPTTSEAARS